MDSQPVGLGWYADGPLALKRMFAGAEMRFAVGGSESALFMRELSLSGGE